MVPLPLAVAALAGSHSCNFLVLKVVLKVVVLKVVVPAQGAVHFVERRQGLERNRAGKTPLAATQTLRTQFWHIGGRSGRALSAGDCHCLQNEQWWISCSGDLFGGEDKSWKSIMSMSKVDSPSTELDNLAHIIRFAINLPHSLHTNGIEQCTAGIFFCGEAVEILQRVHDVTVNKLYIDGCTKPAWEIERLVDQARISQWDGT